MENSNKKHAYLLSRNCVVPGLRLDVFASNVSLGFSESFNKTKVQ